MAPRVFIPQNVTRYDSSRGRVIQAYDFTDAARYGTLKHVFTETDNPLFTEESVNLVERTFADLSHDDFLVAVGDPVAIAMCAGVIARKQGRLNLLKWDKRQQHYIHTRIDFGQAN